MSVCSSCCGWRPFMEYHPFTNYPITAQIAMAVCLTTLTILITVVVWGICKDWLKERNPDPIAILIFVLLISMSVCVGSFAVTCWWGIFF